MRMIQPLLITPFNVFIGEIRPVKHNHVIMFRPIGTHNLLKVFMNVFSKNILSQNMSKRKWRWNTSPSAMS